MRGPATACVLPRSCLLLASHQKQPELLCVSLVSLNKPTRAVPYPLHRYGLEEGEEAWFHVTITGLRDPVTHERLLCVAQVRRCRGASVGESAAVSTSSKHMCCESGTAICLLCSLKWQYNDEPHQNRNKERDMHNQPQQGKAGELKQFCSLLTWALAHLL